jgi:predicted nucleic acid-binding protein
LKATSLPGAVIADANVLLSAVIGGRSRRVLSDPRSPACYAATAVADEVGRYIPLFAKRRGLSLQALTAVYRVLPVSWRGPEVYGVFEAEVRKSLAGRDEDDWPTLALALALDLPIWTQDKDFAVTRIPTYTTGQLLDALGSSERR